MRVKTIWYTCKTEILQSAFVSFKIVIDTKSLVILLQSTELAQKREIFSRVLTYDISIANVRTNRICRLDLLGVLRDQKDQREIIHPKGDVK